MTYDFDVKYVEYFSARDGWFVRATDILLRVRGRYLCSRFQGSLLPTQIETEVQKTLERIGYGTR